MNAHQVHYVRQYKNHAYKVLARYSECFEDEIITEFAQVRQVNHINVKVFIFFLHVSGVKHISESPPPTQHIGVSCSLIRS